METHETSEARPKQNSLMFSESRNVTPTEKGSSWNKHVLISHRPTEEVLTLTISNGIQYYYKLMGARIDAW